MSASLVGSEMCIRDRRDSVPETRNLPQRGHRARGRRQPALVKVLILIGCAALLVLGAFFDLGTSPKRKRIGQKFVDVPRERDEEAGSMNSSDNFIDVEHFELSGFEAQDIEG
eukprot:3616132-Alexandrium_andersonii.AAC.1